MEINVPGVRSFGAVAEAFTPDAENEEALGKTAFLELMIAQIRNQDPLEPAKNEAFIAQLAQFSSVEGIQNLNESMDGLVASLTSSRTMDAANLVGRNVLVPTNQTALNGSGGIAGTIALPQATGELYLEISDTGGNVVKRFDLGAQDAADLRFAWDGLTDAGEPAAQDLYRISAFAEVDGIRQEFEVNLPQQVISVSIEEGGLIANLLGGASVPAVQIKEIQ